MARTCSRTLASAWWGRSARGAWWRWRACTSQPNVYYQGTVGGGVWKTTDSGNSWANVSDGFFKTASVGAVAVAESDPNVVYAGMGESCVRGNASNGDGVYKSVDAGKTWKSVGLQDRATCAASTARPTAARRGSRC